MLLDENSPKLFAANLSEIKSVGFVNLKFSLPNLNKDFQWKFFVADVAQPILGKDFLREHHLLVDS